MNISQISVVIVHFCIHKIHTCILLPCKTSPVANGVGAQIRPVVSHPDHNGGAAILGATRLTEIDPDQLDHVGLKEVHIPGKTAIFSKS